MKSAKINAGALLPGCNLRRTTIRATPIKQPRRLRAAAVEESNSTAASSPAKARRPSPLSRGGTLQGDLAAGKDAGAAAKTTITSKEATVICQVQDGKFTDHRWSGGRWELEKFADKSGSMDWDSVIDAEMARRRILEDTPIDSLREDPVVFDSAEIPWWAWVRRFHLPEAEKLNGRAAMVGYALAWIVDSLSGAGLVDQQNSFLGKLLLHVAVFGILIFRNTDVVAQYKNLLDEATFYDKQWKASWEGQKRPSEVEQ